MADNPLTRHLDEVGESYGEHLAVASRVGFRMIGGGLACLVHGVLPFLFSTTGSRTIRELHRGITKRVDAPNWERHPII
jgi:hypothetical protein